MLDLLEQLNIANNEWLADITQVFLILFLVLGVADDWDKVKGFAKRLLDFRKHIDTLVYRLQRKKYNKTLSQEDFIKWQLDVIKRIYEPIIEKYNSENELLENRWKIQLTSIVLDEREKANEYEAITIDMQDVSFPFKGLCDKDKLQIGVKEEKKRVTMTERQTAFWYRQLIKATIKYPNRLGYMLDKLEHTESGNCHVVAHPGTYIENILTSHILEYELYLLYKKKFDPLLYSKAEILERLPIRNNIHKYFERETDILVSGGGRESLLGVQIFTLVKNVNGRYGALRIRRSENVASKAGYLQFIPSGGFESTNDNSDFDSVWSNYSVCKILFRELLEECFGRGEDYKGYKGNPSPELIYNDEKISRLINLIHEDKVRFEFLGSTMSLVGLRHELSFILRVDDEEFAKKLLGNHESANIIHLIDMERLEQREFWVRKSSNDLDLLNCTSAGLFELARKSDTYQMALAETRKRMY